MALDLIDSVSAQTFASISQEATDEAFGCVRNVDFLREMQGIAMVHDFGIGADERVRVEGCITHEHFVEENADGPPIAFAPVYTLATLGLQNFW